jgi:tellurite resistance protein TerC
MSVPSALNKQVTGANLTGHYMQDILTFLVSDVLDKPLWIWLVFIAIVLLLLALDLGVFHRKDHEIELRESLIFSAFYISIGLLFGGWVWYNLGPDQAALYWTGFVVEKTLSLDNIFVIAMIFSYCAIPRLYQHRVLFWGILGVLILRGLAIGLGAGILHHFEWVLYIFAAFLIYTGVKMLAFDEDEDHNIADNKILKFMHRHFRVTDKLHGNSFFVRLKDDSGKRHLYITPLFVTLVMIEFADLIFAVDSIPAIFAITTDTYIVFTSNVFAILGLRALFFVLAALLNRFEYLKYALSIVLIFIGVKIFASMMGLFHISPVWSLVITVSIIGSGMIYSLKKTAVEEHQD